MAYIHPSIGRVKLNTSAQIYKSRLVTAGLNILPPVENLKKKKQFLFFIFHSVIEKRN